MSTSRNSRAHRPLTRRARSTARASRRITPRCKTVLAGGSACSTNRTPRRPQSRADVFRGGAMNLLKISAALIAAAVTAAVPMTSEAQSGRTLEELKAETQARADRNAYPLIGLKADEVREALGRLKSMDRDEWAASWSQLGDRYMARQDYHQAWLYYSFARWPVPNSPGKQRAYEKALEAYTAYAKKYDPPLEVLRVPYENGEVVGYLRMPKNASAAPLIVAIAGLDS